MNDTAPAFQAFGPSHLAALALTALLTAALVWTARRGTGPPAWRDLGLTALLAGAYAYAVFAAWRGRYLTLETVLPCHLCDAAAACGVYTLLTKNRLTAELTWFWGLAGTANGLITPALASDFPNPAYTAFFLIHGGVVATAVYIVAGLRLSPRRGALWRVFAWTQVYALTAALVNVITGANYGFLRAKPPQASLMDKLGDWPWYIAGLQAMALLLFCLLYLPFVRKNRLSPPDHAAP